MEWADYFYYDESSPTCLRWAVDRAAGRGHKTLYKRRGDVAGSTVTVDKRSGRQVVRASLLYKSYVAARIVWELHNGEIPEGLVVDHINGDSTDNRISNLRVVTQAINARNSKLAINNQTGITGVFEYMNHGKHRAWRATWMDEEGVNRSKSFSERKYGDAAKGMAIAKRLGELAKLDGYTERHGL